MSTEQARRRPRAGAAPRSSGDETNKLSLIVPPTTDEIGPSASVLTRWLASAVDADPQTIAFAVKVEIFTPEPTEIPAAPRYRRRVFLSLSAAEAAVARAEARGLKTKVTLCRVVEVVA